MERLHQTVLFPFLSHGHLIPFVALARLIARQRCCGVTLVATPLNAAKLKSMLLSEPIDVAVLPFRSSDHGLPADIEDIGKTPVHLRSLFLSATEALEPYFESLVRRLQGECKVCIISDMFLGWTVHTAMRLRAFHSVFFTCSAYAASILFSLCLQPSQPVFRDGAQPQGEQQQQQEMVFIGRQVRSIFSGNCDGFLINTLSEVERKGMEMLKKTPNLPPTWAVGPLIRRPSSLYHDDAVIQWLGLHPPRSALYVCFGTMTTITSPEMRELADALLACGKPFVYVVRPPSDGGDRDLDELRERMEGQRQGLLVHGWTPQPEILSHAATGAFLSHCGWNSVMESLSNGVPIIGWPFQADQILNSKIVAEMGAGVEVAKGRLMGGLSNGSRGISDAIQRVMGETEEGREIRMKAANMRELFKNASFVKDDEGDGGGNSLSLPAIHEFLRQAFEGKTSS